MDRFDVVHEAIEEVRPKLVLLSGKTSTGKTTLAKKLTESYDAKLIELDEIVSNIDAPGDINKFVAIYRERDERRLIDNFVTSLRQAIKESLDTHPIAILDGALANTETLQEVIHDWAESFLFVYLEPSDIGAYVDRLKSRFEVASPTDNSGLSEGFWRRFADRDLEMFYSSRDMTPTINDNIYAYAAESMAESAIRLKMFKQEFEDILVVEV